MDNLRTLESKSVYIIREAHNKFKNPAVLWSCGKDSTALLWLCKKAFFGRVPFKVIHIDTGYKFREIYEFRDSVAEKWNLNMEIAGSSSAVKPEDGRFKCCNAKNRDAERCAEGRKA